eukprot:349892-Chlamydomonas_euryale.AAC.1
MNHTVPLGCNSLCLLPPQRCAHAEGLPFNKVGVAVGVAVAAAARCSHSRRRGREGPRRRLVLARLCRRRQGLVRKRPVGWRRRGRRGAWLVAVPVRRLAGAACPPSPPGRGCQAAPLRRGEACGAPEALRAGRERVPEAGCELWVVVFRIAPGQAIADEGGQLPAR